MQASEDGNITTLVHLINKRRIDVNTRGPYDDPWVS